MIGRVACPLIEPATLSEAPLLSDDSEFGGFGRNEMESAGGVEPSPNSAVAVANSRDAKRIPSLRVEGLTLVFRSFAG
jgi:hypothetical protein